MCLCRETKIKCWLNYHDEMLERKMDGARMNVRLNGEELEEMDRCNYLRSAVTVDRRTEASLKGKVKETWKVHSGLRKILELRTLGMWDLYNGIIS